MAGAGSGVSTKCPVVLVSRGCFVAGFLAVVRLRENAPPQVVSSWGTGFFFLQGDWHESLWLQNDAVRGCMKLLSVQKQGINCLHSQSARKIVAKGQSTQKLTFPDKPGGQKLLSTLNVAQPHPIVTGRSLRIKQIL